MLPVQNVLCFRTDKQSQITDVLPSVSEELDLLIHLHILASEQTRIGAVSASDRRFGQRPGITLPFARHALAPMTSNHPSARDG